MKVMLSGDFINVGSRFCDDFLVSADEKLNVLFCAYAFENGTEYNNAQKMALKRAFNVNKIIDLTEDYDFKDKIDVIFVNGGYGIANLVEKLVKSGHDKKILELVKNGTIYIGESSGAKIAGDYSVPQVFEDIEEDLETLNKRRKNFKGFHFVDGVVLTHMSRYRFPKNYSDIATPTYRILNRTSKGVNPLAKNLGIIRVLRSMNVKYITIRENEVLIINNNQIKRKTLEWSKLKIMENVITKDEEKIKNIIAGRDK